MIEIKDIVGLSAPLTRLIDVMSKGIGAVSSPYLIKKNADAKADEIRIVSEALQEVAENHKLPVIYKDGVIEVWQKPEDNSLILEPLPSDQRMAHRLNFQERKRQKNIEEITAVAATELSQDTEVPDEQPDEDWVTRFFDHAHAISSEQMQNLWGRVLAGEIKSPGAFSLKTLDFMKNISQEDAQTLERIGRVAVRRGSSTFISTQDNAELEERYGIQFGSFVAAGELGLIFPNALALKTFSETSVEEELFIHGSKMLVVERAGIVGGVDIPCWKFTSVGKELLGLMPQTGDAELLESLGKYFISKKGAASLNDVVEFSAGGKILYNKIRDITSVAVT